MTPEEAALKLRCELPLYAPDALAKFSRSGGESDPLQVGDSMFVRIKGAGGSAVLVTHVDARGLTLRTMQGHLEAGRNTFGFYQDGQGLLVCRIRSRARVRDFPRLLAYWLGGKATQSVIWTVFLNRVAEACGGTLKGEVYESTAREGDTSLDLGEGDGPTFDALNPPPLPD